MGEAEVLERLAAWGEAQPTVLAMILTSSRARPDGAVDILSDYDLLGLTTYFRGLVYEDGTKIDYTIWPEALLDRIAEEPVLPDMLDVGYRVLLDKDGRASRWKPPTHRAHVPAKPTELEYRDLVEEFWWSMTYIAKSLWRDELVFNRFILEQDIRAGTLRQMLDWRIEIDHDWSLKPGWFGRGLKQLLPAETWSELESTYVGPDREENWDAVFRLTALFRGVAREVGELLGYHYPQKVDDQVTAHLEGVRELR